MNRKHSDKKIYLVAVLVCVLLLAGSITLTYNIAMGDTGIIPVIGQVTSTGKVQFQVVEGFTETPLEGATVVILDTDKSYQTDAQGFSPVIEVPIITDDRFNKILQKPWGEINAIIYKKDYIPYALFYLQVFKDKTRKGVKILLFKEGEVASSEPFSIIEGPNRLWVEQLIKEHQPK
jgi:hypothetical protein